MDFFVLDLRRRFGNKGFANFDILEPFEVRGAPTCPKCNSMIGPMRWLAPHNVKLTEGNLGDAVFGPSEEFFISSRFQTEIENEGIRGFDEEPMNGHGNLFEAGYRLVRPAIRFVHIDESRVEWRGEAVCDKCRSRSWRAVSGVVVEESTWDGTEFFTTPAFTGTMLSSHRVYDLVQDHDLTNFELIPSENYVESFSV